MRMRLRLLTVAGFAASFALATVGGAHAQSQGEAGALVPTELIGQPGENYGTAGISYLNLGNWQFEPVDSTVTFDQLCCTPYTRFRTGSTELWFTAPVNLPNGSQIEQIQLMACDTSATAEVGVFLAIQPNLGTFTETFSTSTGAAAVPGCTTITTTVTPPVIVNNAAAFYGLEAFFTATGSATRLVGARVGYRLRVSPAPATATFTDVPTTHAFHRFVEALAASGITGGCGGGNFCPDSAVTRGQMSVFLATALGLHFPN